MRLKITAGVVAACGDDGVGFLVAVVELDGNVGVPVEVGIELKKIGGVLTAEVTDWIPGTGGGTIGDPVENEVQ